jgi:hypothetical protein
LRVTVHDGPCRKETQMSEVLNLPQAANTLPSISPRPEDTRGKADASIDDNVATTPFAAVLKAKSKDSAGGPGKDDLPRSEVPAWPDPATVLLGSTTPSGLLSQLQAGIMGTLETAGMRPPATDAGTAVSTASAAEPFAATGSISAALPDPVNANALPALPALAALPMVAASVVRLASTLAETPGRKTDALLPQPTGGRAAGSERETTGKKNMQIAAEAAIPAEPGKYGQAKSLPRPIQGNFVLCSNASPKPPLDPPYRPPALRLWQRLPLRPALQ